jgi:hypothetical protein
LLISNVLKLAGPRKALAKNETPPNAAINVEKEILISKMSN